MLYVVSTPIGNLEDITLRALNILKNVDYIVSEDTRHSKKLLSKYNIKNKLISYHSYSNKSKIDKIINLLINKNDIALISDAGTPGISDPGYKIISESKKNDIKVVPIPGASAFLTALQGSGVPMDKFLYLGFLPLKKGRETLIKSFIGYKYTIIFYESCHRILKTLNTLYKHLEPDREIVIAKELTKIHEEYISILSKDLPKKKFNTKGEFVVIIKPV